MNEILDDLVEHIRAGGDPDALGGLSTGQRCFVALAAQRYDLLPATYDDPIEAWQRLEPEWRIGVCHWREWPRSYVYD
jgi:hypothetical protein